MPSSIVVTPFIRSFSVSFSPSAEVDVSGYLIHAVPEHLLANGTFEPTEANKINQGPETSFFYTLPTGAPAGNWAVRVAAYDTFGIDELNYSAVQLAYIPTLNPQDTVAPEMVTFAWAAPAVPETGLDGEGVFQTAYVNLAWTLVEPDDFSNYLIRWKVSTDANWVAELSATTKLCKVGGLVAGLSYDFQVAAVDRWSNISDWSTTKTVAARKDAIAPAAPASLSAYVVDRWVELAWTPPTDPDLAGYELRMGDSASTWDSAASIATPAVPTRTYLWAPNRVGTLRFFLKAVDASGNWSSPRQSVQDLVIKAPQFAAGAVVIPQVIDNNVLLKWPDAVVGSYPIAFYRLRRSAAPHVFADATVIGDKQGTFTVVFETTSYTYKYWVSPVDTAGIEGDAIGVYASVSQPPDYRLQDVTQFAPAWSGTKVSAAVDSSTALVLPISTTETFQSHFTSRGWDQPSDQITAGYPVYAQPGLASGYYEQTVDYGVTIASSKITLDVTRTTLSGTVTITPTISVSLDNSTWTSYVDVYQVYATNFRYARYRIAVTSADGGVVALSAAQAKLESKQKTYEGTVACSSADVGGTAVDIAGKFIDVTSIQITPMGTTPIIALYDFADVVNPTSFKVFLYNPAGGRVSGTASFLLRGV